MKKITLLLVSLLVLGATAQKTDFAINEFYPVESSHSYIEFSVTYMGYAKVKGNFEDFSGAFRYDPEDISKTSVTFMIKTESIDTDLEWRDNDLKSENWFDAEKFPYITFQSTQIIDQGEGFQVEGDLTIRDVTKSVTLNMNPASGILKDIRGDLQVILSGEHELDRTEYGVAGERWSQVKENIVGVANDISIEFSMLGKQIQEANMSNWVRNEKRPPGRLYAAYKEGGVKQTLSEFKKMKNEMELNEFALATVGVYVLTLGETKDAIALLEKNVAEFPNKPRATNTLGEAYATVGDLKKASIQYQKTLESDSTDVTAKEMLRHLK